MKATFYTKINGSGSTQPITLTGDLHLEEINTQAEVKELANRLQRLEEMVASLKATELKSSVKELASALSTAVEVPAATVTKAETTVPVKPVSTTEKPEKSVATTETISTVTARKKQ